MPPAKLFIDLEAVDHAMSHVDTLLLLSDGRLMLSLGHVTPTMLRISLGVRCETSSIVHPRVVCSM